MKNICFTRFFYSNLLILGVHLGGQKNKIRKDINTFAMCEYNNFYCLDIKQSFKELKKILLLIEYICSNKGKLLIASGNIFIMEPDLAKLILCRHKSLVAFVDANFAGFVTNYVRPKYGIPSLSFLANSDRCWYGTAECFSFAIPTISFADLHMFQPFIINLMVYNFLGNSKSSHISVFFIILFSFCLLISKIRSKSFFFRKGYLRNLFFF